MLFQQIIASPTSPLASQSTAETAKPTPVSQYRQHASRAFRKRTCDVDKEYLDIEKKKLKLFESRSADISSNDPDRHFLMSLIPYMKEVPRNRKLLVQQKLLQVFVDEDRVAPSKHTQDLLQSEYTNSPLSVYSSDDGTHEQPIFINDEPAHSSMKNPISPQPNTVLYEVCENNIGAYSFIGPGSSEDIFH